MVGWEKFLALSWPRTARSEGCVPMLYLGLELTFRYVAKPLTKLAPRAGFELANNRLTAVTKLRSGCKRRAGVMCRETVAQPRAISGAAFHVLPSL